MRRYSGQRALYEAMSRSRSKRKRPSLLERLRPQLAKLRELGAARMKRPGKAAEPVVEKPAPVTLKPPKMAELSEPMNPGPAQTWLRPKAVQINGGCIEVSLPYQIGIIIGLGLTLLVLIAFWFGVRLGRIDERSRYNTSPEALPASVGDVPVGSGGADVETPSSEPAVKPAPTVSNAGDNVIVLARHQVQTQLVPVREYFSGHGIDTRILSYETLRSHFGKFQLDASRLPKGEGFMLVTYNLYDNPSNEGTDGYAAKQEIVKLGRDYKAPRGYETFARSYFSDAYGMKIR